MLGVDAAGRRITADDLCRVDARGVIDWAHRERRDCGVFVIDLDLRLDRRVARQRSASGVGIGEREPEATTQPREEVQRLTHWCTTLTWSIARGDGRCTNELKAP